MRAISLPADRAGGLLSAYKELAARTGLAPSSYLARVRSLRARGVISGFRAELHVAPAEPEQLRAVRNRLGGRTEIAQLQTSLVYAHRRTPIVQRSATAQLNETRSGRARKRTGFDPTPALAPAPPLRPFRSSRPLSRTAGSATVRTRTTRPRN